MPSAPDSRSPLAMPSAFSLLASAGLVAVAVVREGVIVQSSPRFDAIFGLGAGGGAPALGSLVAAIDRDRVLATIGAVAPTPERPFPSGGHAPLAFDGLRADGSVFRAEVLWASSASSGGPLTVLMATDATERNRMEQQLSYMAYLDPLTGLANRALFLDRLRETLAAARRDDRMFAVLQCDLDGFKKVNDTLGHEAGDALLVTVARRLEGSVRGGDTVARHGGDEFAAILPGLRTPEDAGIVAARMVRSMDAPIEVAGALCKVGISIGVASFPGEGTDMDALIGRADAAMYASKQAGKNRFTYAAAGDRSSAMKPAPLFLWRPEHEVGVSIIDVQHRELVDRLNDLVELLKAGRDRDSILASLKALVVFTKRHFATEERLMAHHPGWAQEIQHTQEHRKLLDDLMSLTINADVKSMTLTTRFLQEWLSRHIETEDKPLGAWLAPQLVRATPDAGSPRTERADGQDGTWSAESARILADGRGPRGSSS